MGRAQNVLLPGSIGDVPLVQKPCRSAERGQTTAFPMVAVVNAASLAPTSAAGKRSEETLSLAVARKIRGPWWRQRLSSPARAVTFRHPLRVFRNWLRPRSPLAGFLTHRPLAIPV